MDEDEPKPKLHEWPPKTVDHLSVEALEAYGQALEAELARVRKTLDARGKHRAAADAMFKR
jgi:uncharacterized small protein (DUF1192 family)